MSKRTKDAMQIAKTRGMRFGNPDPRSASKKAVQVLKVQTVEYQMSVRPLLQKLQQEGYTLSGSAQELNRRGVPTARGGRWYATTVKNILQEPPMSSSNACALLYAKRRRPRLTFPTKRSLVERNRDDFVSIPQT